MYDNARDAYLESRVLSADPLELVRLLYQGAIGSVQSARHHLANGRIAERSQAISRVSCILIELNSALDHVRGGEIAARLAALYDYLQRKLLEANFSKSDPLLEEVLGILTTLASAWNQIGQPVPQRVAQPDVWSQPLPEAAAAGYAPAGWSL